MLDRKEYPASWAKSTLEEICLPVDQMNLKRDYDEDFSYIEVSGIDNAGHKITKAKTIQAKTAPSRAKQMVKANDVVFSNVRVYLENIALVSQELDGQIASTAFSVLRPASEISPELLFYYLTSKPFIRSLIALQRGNSPPAVLEDDVRAQPFLLPPKQEQTRIVSKIEELFSDLDKGEENLRRVQALIGRYRQSVLKAAVTGELTRDWREKNKDSIETGEQLLKRILKARRKAWEKAELAKMHAKGEKPKNDKWKKKYKEPIGPDTSRLPELPEGWVWANLEMISDLKGGITVDRKKQPEDGESVPYLRVANVQDCTLHLAEIKNILASKGKIKQLALKSGDILFNEGGDLDKLGRGWVWEDQIPLCIHQNHVFRARLYLADLPPKLVSYYASAMGKSYFMGEGKQTTNLASISLTKMKAFSVPIPSTTEAAIIARAIDERLTGLNVFRKGVEEADKQAKAQRQSILKAAFSGKLVPQGPNDEPASELLKRIAEEKAKAEVAKPKCGGPKKTAPKGKKTPSKLAKARKKAGITQAKLAKAAGINPAYISPMENGRRSITPEQAEKLAGVLGVTTESLQ